MQFPKNQNTSLFFFFFFQSGSVWVDRVFVFWFLFVMFWNLLRLRVLFNFLVENQICCPIDHLVVLELVSFFEKGAREKRRDFKRKSFFFLLWNKILAITPVSWIRDTIFDFKREKRSICQICLIQSVCVCVLSVLCVLCVWQKEHTWFLDFWRSSFPCYISQKKRVNLFSFFFLFFSQG